MSWHTEILNARTAACCAAERDHPYLYALLLHPPRLAAAAAERARNLVLAREAERRRAATVAHAPYHLVLDPSDLCNLRCPLCVHVTDPSGRRRRLLSDATADRVLGALGRKAIRLDLFNWGEPLLNPAFPAIVERATRMGLYTRTSSHFSHDPPIDWDALVAAGLRYIVASVDGTTQPTYARYRVGGTLAAVERNLAALAAAKRRAGSVWPLVEWQFLAFRHNVHELDSARMRAHALGADIFRYGGARAEMGSKAMLGSPEGVARSADYLVAPDHPLSEYDEHGEKRRDEERHHCRWLWGKLAVHADGRAAPCWNGWRAEHDLGGGGADLLQVWQGDAFRRARLSAETGGDPAGSTLCDSCAHNRAFVPPPDHDVEPLLHSEALASLAARLSEATGWTPAADVVAAIDAAMQPALRPVPA